MLLVARIVDVSEEYGAIQLAFGDAEAAPANYILLQRCLEPAAQDIALGLGGVYLEINDQSASSYFNSIEAELQRDRLLIHFPAAGTPLSQYGDAIEVQFEVGDQQFSAMRKACAQLFGDRLSCQLDA